MEKIIFKNEGEEGASPLSPAVLKQMQDNVENSFKSNQTTSDKDTYSCNYINQITSKSAIIVSLTENKTITHSTAWNFYIVPFDEIQGNFGSTFSLNNNGTITYNKTSGLVKVTLHLKINSTSGSVYPEIVIGGSVAPYQSATNSGYIDIIYIASITQGQIISGDIRPSAVGSTVLGGDDMYTYMIVEEI